MKFKTSGVCSRAIDFDVVDGKVVNVHFTGGCAGNTQGVAALIILIKADIVEPPSD